MSMTNPASPMSTVTVTFEVDADRVEAVKAAVRRDLGGTGYIARISRRVAPTLAPAAPPLQLIRDAPFCMTCGNRMQPAGSCHVCDSCGSTSGCS